LTLLDGDGEFVKILKTKFVLFGYSYIPRSNKILKDWEKLDKALDENKIIRIEGIQSHSGKIEPVNTIDTHENTDSMQNDFFNKFKPSFETLQASGHTLIWCTHDPPFNTPLDNCWGTSVGSYSIRGAIDTYQPLLTFHGHIHETVDCSREYSFRSGSSWSFSSGERYNKPNLSFIIVETSNPSFGKRYCE